MKFWGTTLRQHHLLIFLMAFSFSGLIALQSYWFYDAYKVKEEKFEREAIEAIEAASFRLENLETLRFLFGKLAIEPIFSGQFEPFFLPDEDSALALNAPQLEIKVSLDEDTLIVATPDKRSRRPRFLFAGQSANQDTTITREGSEMFMRKARQLDFVLRKMMFHELQRRNSLSEILSIDVLDSILDLELKHHGIPLKYEFAVIQDNKALLNSNHFDINQHLHLAKLFPNDIFNNQMLALTFPGKANYLLKSLWAMIVLGVLLTTLLIFAFAQTLKYSYKQKRISEIKTDFINNMTHEFKTPIATINLAVDSLKSPAVINDKERILQYGEIIKQENRRMNLQVESVLRLALMDKQELQLKKEKISVEALINEAVETIALQLQNRGGQLKKFVNFGETPLSVDKQHITNTLVNILDNALKYSPENPQIEIKTEKRASFYIITISDQGMGMTKEELSHVFDRFYRVTRGDVHDIKGHGLGLSYANGIVQAHAGKIEVKSEKDKGSAFSIYLPL